MCTLWCWRDLFFPCPSPCPHLLSLPPVQTTTQCLSTEINYSLTQTKNLPVRRESSIKVTVALSLFPLPVLLKRSLYLSNASSSFSPLLLTNQVTAPRCKPLFAKTLWDVVLIMADFVAAPLGVVVSWPALMWPPPLLTCWLSRANCGQLTSRVQTEEERKLFVMADESWITQNEASLVL